MTQATTITDKDGRKCAEVLDASGTVALAVAVVSGGGGDATEATLQSVANSVANVAQEPTLQSASTLIEQLKDITENLVVVLLDKIRDIGSSTLQFVASTDAHASIIASESARKSGVFRFATGTTTTSFSFPSGSRLQRILVVGAASGVVPKISFVGGASTFTNQDLPRSLMTEIQVSGRAASSSQVVFTNCSWWGVEYVQ